MRQYLKLTDNRFYVGQTIDQTLRYQEHRDGAHPSTKWKGPKLVYFEEISGNRTKATKREDKLTLLTLDGGGKRKIRALIEEFRTPHPLMHLVDFES